MRQRHQPEQKLKPEISPNDLLRLWCDFWGKTDEPDVIVAMNPETIEIMDAPGTFRVGEYLARLEELGITAELSGISAMCG